MQTRRCSVTHVVLLSLAVIIIGLDAVQGQCDPCVCVTSAQGYFMLCQGQHITRYPRIPFEVMRKVHRIEISDTYISCLPDIMEDDYPLLYQFEEVANPYFNCECMSTWFQYLGHAIRRTSCPIPNTKAATTPAVTTEEDSSRPTTATAITTPSTPTRATTINNCDTPKTTTSVASLNNTTTSTTTPNSQLDPILISISIVLPIMAIALIVVICVYRFQTHGTTTPCPTHHNPDDLEMTFINPIFQGPRPDINNPPDRAPSSADDLAIAQPSPAAIAR